MTMPESGAPWTHRVNIIFSTKRRYHTKCLWWAKESRTSQMRKAMEISVIDIFSILLSSLHTNFLQMKLEKLNLFLSVSQALIWESQFLLKNSDQLIWLVSVDLFSVWKMPIDCTFHNHHRKVRCSSSYYTYRNAIPGSRGKEIFALPPMSLPSPTG